jgi:cytochrome c553
MQAQHQSSSGVKATTPARHLVATAIIGAAMIGYLVHKTTDARLRLEGLTTMAQNLGELSASDLAVVAQLLAKQPVKQMPDGRPAA